MPAVKTPQTSSKNISNMFKNLLKDSKYLIIISIAGFLLTGIITYPYGISYDDVFVYMQVLGEIPFGNWMGWFYPILWKILNTITNLNFSIVLFCNIIYWFSMLIIYHTLFSFLKTSFVKYHLFFILFSFSPTVIVSLMNIHNTNIIMCLFLLVILFIIGLFTTNKKNYKIIYKIAIVFLLLGISFIRKEAIVSSIIFLLLLISQDTIGYKKKLLALVVCFFTSFFLINGYMSKNLAKHIDNISVISMFDLAGMSYYKKELLIPNKYLTEEYQGENNQKALNLIYKKWDRTADFKVFNGKDGINTILKSKNSWFIDISIKELIPIYINNLKWYIVHRVLIFYSYFTGVDMGKSNSNYIYAVDWYPDLELGRLNKSGPFFYNASSIPLKRESLLYDPSKITLVKQARLYLDNVIYILTPFYALWSYILMNIFVLYIMYSKKYHEIYTYKEKNVILCVVLSGIIHLTILLIAVTSVQFRYMMWYVLSSWISFFFVVAKLSSKISLQISNKEE